MAHNEIIAVCGMRDHGKSTWLRQFLADVEKLIIVDTLGDHGYGKKSIAPWCRLPRQPADLGSVLEEIEETAEREPNWQFAVPLPTEEEEQLTWFDFLCREAYQTAEYTGLVTLAVEEMGYFTNPVFTPPGLNLVIQYGAHAPINLVWTARNLGEVSRRLTSETDIYIMFAIHEPRWLDAVAERLGRENADRCHQLVPGRYIAVGKHGELIKEESLW